MSMILVTKTDYSIWVDVWPSFASFHDELQTRQFGAGKPDPKNWVRGSGVVRAWNDQTLPRNDQTFPWKDQTLPWFQKHQKISFWFQLKNIDLFICDLVGLGRSTLWSFSAKMTACQVRPHMSANCAIPQRRLHPTIPSKFFMWICVQIMISSQQL